MMSPTRNQTNPVPGAPRVASRVSPGVVPRPTPQAIKGRSPSPAADRYTHFRERATKRAARYQEH